MASSYTSRRFKDLPTYHLTFPVRYEDEETLQTGVLEIQNCIRFVEEQTGAKWNWDAYFTAMKRFNEETRFELQKWEVNQTNNPQLIGPTYELFRKWNYEMDGGLDPRVLESFKKVNRLMTLFFSSSSAPNRQSVSRLASESDSPYSGSSFKSVCFMSPPFFTASLSRASAAVVPCVPQTSRPSSSRMRATLSPTAGVGASDRSTTPNGTPSRLDASCATSWPVRVMRKAVFLIVSATSSKGRPRTACSAWHTTPGPETPTLTEQSPSVTP